MLCYDRAKRVIYIVKILRFELLCNFLFQAIQERHQQKKNNWSRAYAIFQSPVWSFSQRRLSAEGAKQHSNSRSKRACVMYVYDCISMFFFEDFSGLRALREAERVPFSRILDNAFIRHAIAQWCSQRQSGTWLYSHRFKIMVRVVSATVARNLGSGSSLPKLRKKN